MNMWLNIVPYNGDYAYVWDYIYICMLHVGLGEVLFELDSWVKIEKYSNND